MNSSNKFARREVSSRKTNWARRTASFLARARVKPNAISLLSVFFAMGSGASLVLSPAVGETQKIILFLSASILIQLRLLCNLFDGMVAVEWGLKTKSGEIFNDLPDRFSDPLIIVGAGYAVSAFRFGVELGWLAGILAVLTAYVRVLAGSLGVEQSFSGPMAKQHRMAVMTIALIVAAAGVKGGWHEYSITIALSVIVLGSVITLFRRAVAAVREMESS
jgi:phosphatidylglycerophosphate synthase